MTKRTATPLARLRHHVTGAIERGEKKAIVAVPPARPVTIGTHRGKPRLWLEGAWLSEAGFGPRARFTWKFRSKPQPIIIRLEVRTDGIQQGNRVSRKTKGGVVVSVIDINSADLPFSGPALVTNPLNGVLEITQKQEN